MFKLIWRYRAARAYQRIGELSWSQAWEMAGALADDYRPDDYSPSDAVREDMTYWQS